MHRADWCVAAPSCLRTSVCCPPTVCETRNKAAQDRQKGPGVEPRLPNRCDNQHTDLSKPTSSICKEPRVTELFWLPSGMAHGPGTQRRCSKHQMAGGLFIAEKAEELYPYRREKEWKKENPLRIHHRIKKFFKEF